MSIDHEFERLLSAALVKSINDEKELRDAKVDVRADGNDVRELSTLIHRAKIQRETLGAIIGYRQGTDRFSLYALAGEPQDVDEHEDS